MILNKLIQTAVVLALLAASNVTLAAGVSASDASFLKKAAQSGLFEVSGGNLALKKSKNSCCCNSWCKSYVCLILFFKLIILLNFINFIIFINTG